MAQEEEAQQEQGQAHHDAAVVAKGGGGCRGIRRRRSTGCDEEGARIPKPVQHDPGPERARPQPHGGEEQPREEGGASLQDGMWDLVRRFADDNAIDSHDDMARIGLNPTRRQIRDVTSRVTRDRNPLPFRDAWAGQFVADKFGMATTHWSKLQERVQRGVGNPCPLVLIGLPASIVTFGESRAEVMKLLGDQLDLFRDE